MINDPIVNEIRQLRRAYAEQFNNDIHAICEDLRRQERESERTFRTPGHLDSARDAAQLERNQPAVSPGA